ncbi:MAG TPA: DinB family protein [Candidatus Eisenbacteria bacterium]
MSKNGRQAKIAQYAAGYDEVAGALEGFPREGLVAHPIPGKWSACEIVQHLADSESISGIRLRRLLAEEFPVIQAYDQEVFAVILRYNLRDIRPALELFRAVRASTTQLLEAMSDEDWRRPGWHTEHGLYTAESWLDIYAVHAHNHAGQIRRLHEALKK